LGARSMVLYDAGCAPVSASRADVGCCWPVHASGGGGGGPGPGPCSGRLTRSAWDTARYYPRSGLGNGASSSRPYGAGHLVAYAQALKPSPSLSDADGVASTWPWESASWISSEGLRPGLVPLVRARSNETRRRLGSGPTVGAP